MREARSGEPLQCYPLLVAAWLHHRFAHVHSFAHGNSRVTRALVTWHLIWHDYLPIVVTRDAGLTPTLSRPHPNHKRALRMPPAP